MPSEQGDMAGYHVAIKDPLVRDGEVPQGASSSGLGGFIVNNGYIFLHRKLLDNPLCRKPHWGWLWVVLLLKANHEEAEFIWNGELMRLKKGQFVTGRKHLAEESGIPEGTVEDILNYLEKQQQIQQRKTTKYRVVTILNWHKYQKTDSKPNNRATTEQQQSNTNKNDKKEKNEKETNPAPSADVVALITAFKEVNTSYDQWFKRLPQRLAAGRLASTHGLQKVLQVIAILPKTNTMPYIPTITTPIQLEDKWAQLEAGLRKKKLELTTKGRGIA